MHCASFEQVLSALPTCSNFQLQHIHRYLQSSTHAIYICIIYVCVCVCTVPAKKCLSTRRRTMPASSSFRLHESLLQFTSFVYLFLFLFLLFLLVSPHTDTPHWMAARPINLYELWELYIILSWLVMQHGRKPVFKYAQNKMKGKADTTLNK